MAICYTCRVVLVVIISLLPVLVLADAPDAMGQSDLDLILSRIEPGSLVMDGKPG